MDDPSDLKNMYIALHRLGCDGFIALISNRSEVIRVERVFGDGRTWIRTNRNWKIGGPETNWEVLRDDKCTGKFIVLYWLNPSGELAELPTYEDD